MKVDRFVWVVVSFVFVYMENASDHNQLILPEFRIRVVEDYFCRTLCRGEEVRSINTKTFKERGGNEMRSICLQGR